MQRSGNFPAPRSLPAWKMPAWAGMERPPAGAFPALQAQTRAGYPAKMPQLAVSAANWGCFPAPARSAASGASALRQFEAPPASSFASAQMPTAPVVAVPNRRMSSAALIPGQLVPRPAQAAAFARMPALSVRTQVALGWQTASPDCSLPASFPGWPARRRAPSPGRAVAPAPIALGWLAGAPARPAASPKSLASFGASPGLAVLGRPGRFPALFPPQFPAAPQTSEPGAHSLPFAPAWQRAFLRLCAVFPETSALPAGQIESRWALAFAAPRLPAPSGAFSPGA